MSNWKNNGIFCFVIAPISIADYLDGKLASPRKHEFVDGVVYVMAEAYTQVEFLPTDPEV